MDQHLDLTRELAVRISLLLLYQHTTNDRKNCQESSSSWSFFVRYCIYELHTLGDSKYCVGLGWCSMLQTDGCPSIAHNIHTGFRMFCCKISLCGEPSPISAVFCSRSGRESTHRWTSQSHLMKRSFARTGIGNSFCFPDRHELLIRGWCEYSHFRRHIAC